MISKGHKKHADVVKPLGGRFNRNEVAILGAPCGVIQRLASEVNSVLKSRMKVAYVDADHGSGSEAPGYDSNYTDKIGYHQVNFHNSKIDFKFRFLFQDSDLVLVNGNHFKAEKQIVILNPKKEESLGRKLDRLTNVKLFVLDEGIDELFPFLKENIEGFESIPTVKISEIGSISKVVEAEVLSRNPPLKGLVLAGGKSTRMGHDKGAINYHGKEQREYTADLLAGFCQEVFISTREDQGIDSGYKLLEDSFKDLGPYGGILSAFREDPNSAWLVVATDIPNLDNKTLKFLVENRNRSKMATSFHNPETGFPEPLITIWEPRAYPTLLQFLAMGYTCPRKALINNDIEELDVDNTEVLFNANTPGEMEQVMASMKKSETSASS